VKFASPDAPPANVKTCEDDVTFVTTTLIAADVSPTTVLANASVVGVIKNIVPVPDNEIVPDPCPLIEKLVVVECGPGVCGTNSYVKAHDAPGARTTPPHV
jgi:hypothetical protein